MTSNCAPRRRNKQSGSPKQHWVIAESSELVIGGHRDGTGRNYNGLIDEVGLWARVLEPEEIAALADAGQAPVISTELRAADSDGDGSQDRQEIPPGPDPG